MSDFESISLTPVRIWNENFTMHQNLKRKFLWKIEFFWKICSQWINFTVSFYTVKATKLALSCFLANLDSDNFFVKNSTFLQPNFFEHLHILNRVFGNLWDFWTKMFEHVVFRAIFSKFANILIENLRTYQIIKFSGETFVQKKTIFE